MELSLSTRRWVCFSVIVASGVLPGLILAIGPWPIPIHLTHGHLDSSWYRASRSYSIYIVKVRSTGSIFLRSATCEVLEVIKGPPLPPVIHKRLGEIVGEDDAGKTFLVFHGCLRRVLRSVEVGHDPTLIPGKSSVLYVNGSEILRGHETVEFVRQVVKVQSAGARLTEEQARLVRGWLQQKEWRDLIRPETLGWFLKERDKCPLARELLALLDSG